jgi:hypothetical protein
MLGKTTGKCRYGIAIISLVFGSQGVMAYSCNEYRLDVPGSAFDRIPVYNQLDSRGVDANICYAIASSQLVDEYRFRNGDTLERLSSPISLAIGYKLNSQDPINRTYNHETISSHNITDSIFGGGFIEETLSAVSQIELCDQNAIEKEAGLTHADSFTKLNSKSAQRFIEETLLAENTSRVRAYFKFDFVNEVKARLESLCGNNRFSLNRFAVKSLSAGNYLVELIKLTQLTAESLISESERQKLRLEFAQKYNRSKIIERYRDKVNSLLEQKIPIGIGYFMKVLKKKSGTSEFAAHASIITGQRRSDLTGACELLVRDSYGSSCKDRGGEDRYSLPCENGSVWVPLEELLGETSKISWIP